MLVDKADQARLHALMREAVTMLCKTGLNFESKFCVEGLLGITVDDKNIMLINLNETVMRDEQSDSCDELPADAPKMPEDQILPALTKGGSDAKEDNTNCENHTKKTTAAIKSCRRRSKGKSVDTVKTVPEEQNVSQESDSSTAAKRSFFSPTVDQIIQEYEQQQYTDSSSLLYMARKRRRKYPANLTELHTQGLLPILPPNDTFLPARPRVAAAPSPATGAEVVVTPVAGHAAVPTRSRSSSSTPPPVIKREPGLSDTEESTNSSTVIATSSKQLGTIKPILIEPKVYWKSVLKKRPKSADSNALQVSSGPFKPSGGPSESTKDDLLWIEDAILKQEGCFVSTRVVLRKYGALRGEYVGAAMRFMTHRRGDPRYVGEYKQTGRIQIFYKCPPVLLRPRALARYHMTLDQYSNHFFGNPKPNNGTPNQWSTYVNTILEGVPYSPRLFPLESMELDEGDFRRLATKRNMLQDAFGESSADGDGGVIGAFKVDSDNDDHYYEDYGDGSDTGTTET